MFFTSAKTFKEAIIIYQLNFTWLSSFKMREHNQLLVFSVICHMTGDCAAQQGEVLPAQKHYIPNSVKDPFYQSPNFNFTDLTSYASKPILYGLQITGINLIYPAYSEHHSFHYVVLSQDHNFKLSQRISELAVF